MEQIDFKINRMLPESKGRHASLKGTLNIPDNLTSEEIVQLASSMSAHISNIIYKGLKEHGRI